MKKPYLGFLLIALAFKPSHSSCDSTFYAVEGNDNLSTILYRLNLKPLYGKKGSVKSTLLLNPWLKKNKGELIFKDQIIRLPRIPNSIDVQRNVAAQETSEEVKDNAVYVPEIHPSAEAVAPPVEEQISAPLVLLAPSEVEAEEEETESKIKASFGYDYFKIDAVDKQTKDKATIISKSSPTIALAWELSWGPKWSSEFGILYRQDNIANDTKSQKSLSKTTYGRMNSFFGVNRIWSKKNKSQIFVGRSERGFIRSKNATELRLDPVTSTDFGAKHEIILFERKKASAGLEAMFTYLGSGTAPGYSVDPGHFARGSIFMRHQTKTVLIEARGSYGFWDQNSPYVTQKAQEVGTSLSFGWVFK
jgi:hypothetical protein